MSPSLQLTTLTTSFTRGLRCTLGANLVGAYIYGAAAFPEGAPLGDVDFHVILRRSLTEKERTRLERLHEQLTHRFPPLGGELDGYYILLAHARRSTPPRSEMWARATDNAWALHRAHIHAGRCLVLHGPEPCAIYSPASWPELEAALWNELSYVRRHLQDAPAYCILNLCRLIYSFQTRDVVISKSAAAAWARTNLADWRRYIGLAETSYAGQATPQDQDFMRAGVARFYEFAQSRISRA